ncbi:ArsR/SmtB family transcription factor [Streptomyces sp. NPDC002671]
MTEEPQQHKVRELDARSLKGLAHPLRMELLNALRRGGPATASQLAEKLGESSGATSYHLRQLAVYGFVEDAPEQGKGRERWWQAADQGLSMSDDLISSPDPAVRGAADFFLHEALAAHHRELSTFMATRQDWLPKWSDASDMSDMTLRLTPELAAELIQKMHALIDGYRDRVTDADTPDAEQVRVHTHLFPIETD